MKRILTFVLFLWCSPVAAQVQVGDMILDRDPWTDPIAAPAGASYFAWSGGGIPWPGGVVPVEFGFPATQIQRELFFRACGEWTKVAGVSCIKRTTQTSYVTVMHTLGCSSYVGASPVGGQRIIHLAYWCWDDGTIMHEIGHIIGLGHEHQRPDRDSYITVDTTCLGPGAHTQYQIIPSIVPLTAYDPSSLMHYPWSCVIGPHPNYPTWGPLFGQVAGPSASDGVAARAIYGSPNPAGFSEPNWFGFTPYSEIAWTPGPTAANYHLEVSPEPNFKAGRTFHIAWPSASGIWSWYVPSFYQWVGTVYMRVAGESSAGMTMSTPKLSYPSGMGSWSQIYLFQPSSIHSMVTYSWTGPPGDSYTINFRTSPAGAIISAVPVGNIQTHSGPCPSGTYYVTVSSNTLGESNQVVIVIP